MGVDIVGPLPITREGNRYIVVAMDYFSRWPEARPFKAANVNTVVTFLFIMLVYFVQNIKLYYINNNHISRN